MGIVTQPGSTRVHLLPSRGIKDSVMPKSQPYYPNKGISYGSLYFYLRQATVELNPFCKQSLAEAKHILLREARDASPSYKLFIKAATMATGLSERTIKSILYKEQK